MNSKAQCLQSLNKKPDIDQAGELRWPGHV